MQYLYISWKQIQQAVESALEKLDRPIKGIIAVTRGGLVPAGFIAQQLGIKNVKVVCLESYTDTTNTQGKVRCVLPLPAAEELQQYIFVDDIIDSGKTVTYLKQKYPTIEHLVLFAKPHSVHLLDYYGRLLTPAECKQWLVFPWYSEFLKSETFKNTP